jgi:mRNA-degrading endonuclease HigB of HigAB toxin-antitoxin module
MTNEFINGIIEQMFNKTDFNQNSLNDIFSNNQQYNNELVKLFLLAFIKQFNPDEIKFILQNKNIKNSNLNLVFNENVEKLLSQVNIDINFQKIILQVINSQDFELIKIIYQIIKFCRDHKKKDIIFGLKE